MHPSLQHTQRLMAWRDEGMSKLKFMLWAALILSAGCVSDADPTSAPEPDPCLGLKGAWRVEDIKGLVFKGLCASSSAHPEALRRG